MIEPINKNEYKVYTLANAKRARIFTQDQRFGLLEVQLEGDKRAFPLGYTKSAGYKYRTSHGSTRISSAPD
jgi:hypothetical protein